MGKFFATWCVIAFAVASTASFAEENHGSHGDLSNHAQDGSLETITVKPGTVATGVAVINSVDVDTGMVNLTHEPMPKLGWPTMTMDLPATKRVDISSYKKGDNVAFKLKLGRDNKYRIIEIVPSSKGSEHSTHGD